MKDSKNLFKELAQSGASDKELQQFQSVVERLASVSSIQRSNKHKVNFLRNSEAKRSRYINKHFFVPAIAFVLFLLIGGSVVKAQTTLPGDSLYPVKRLSEDIYSKLNPNFRNDVIVRRSEEIKEMTEQKRDSTNVEKTIRDYQEEVSKQEKHDDKTFEESQKNLREAAEKATEENKKEIEKTLMFRKSNGSKEVKGEETKNEKLQELERPREKESKKD